MFHRPRLPQQLARLRIHAIHHRTTVAKEDGRNSVGFPNHDARTDACISLEAPLDTSRGSVEGVQIACQRAHKYAAARYCRLAARYRYRAQVERPFELEPRHVRCRKPRRCRLLKSSIGDARAPATPSAHPGLERIVPATALLKRGLHVRAARRCDVDNNGYQLLSR